RQHVPGRGRAVTDADEQDDGRGGTDETDGGQTAPTHPCSAPGPGGTVLDVVPRVRRSRDVGDMVGDGLAKTIFDSHEVRSRRPASVDIPRWAGVVTEPGGSPGAGGIRGSEGSCWDRRA